MYRDRSTVIRKIVIISALLLILGGGIFALHSVYTVRTVYVEGNVHYTEDEIKEIVMSGPLGNNSLYLSEEMKITYQYRRLIKANDRATLLNLMSGLNAYTL